MFLYFRFLNYSDKTLYGSKKCPRINPFIDLLPDCPIYYVLQNDSNRIPTTIVNARCSCKRCRHDHSGEKNCKEVYTYTRVMRRLDSCQFEPVLEAVSVACACSSTAKVLPAGQWFFFQLTWTEVSGGAFIIGHRPSSSVRPFIIFFKLHFQNHWVDSNQTWQKWLFWWFSFKAVQRIRFKAETGYHGNKIGTTSKHIEKSSCLKPDGPGLLHLA